MKKNSCASLDVAVRNYKPERRGSQRVQVRFDLGDMGLYKRPGVFSEVSRISFLR